MSMQGELVIRIRSEEQERYLRRQILPALLEAGFVPTYYPANNSPQKPQSPKAKIKLRKKPHGRGRQKLFSSR